MTGKTKTVFTPLAPSMVTIGMMCHVLTAITTPVIKVQSIEISFSMLFLMSHIALLDIFKTAFNKVVAHTGCHRSKQTAWKSNNTDQTK